MFGIDIAAFTAIEMNESSESGHPNEIAFSSKNKGYDEDYSGDKSGISLYKAAAKFKFGPTSGARWLHSTNRTDSVGSALELYAVPIRVLKPEPTSTMVMLVH